MTVATVILADGEFPRAERLLRILRTAGRVVCCDGAAGSLLAFGREPDRVVGDMDSLSGACRARLADRVVVDPEQETNDLAKAFRLCRRMGWTESVAILGATGKREDHTLGNLSYLVEFSEECPSIRILSERMSFFCVRSGESVAVRPGGQVSLFSFDPAQRITSEGLKWPLQDRSLPLWRSGTLNEATGGRFSLRFSGRTPILVGLLED